MQRSLEEWNPDIGMRRTFQRKEMAQPEEEESLTKSERTFCQYFLHMKFMVEELYIERKKNGEVSIQVKFEEGGGDPPQMPPSPSTTSSLSPSPSQKGKLEKNWFQITFVKIGCKIWFSMYNGKLNEKKDR